jgi:hypothetical protein
MEHHYQNDKARPGLGGMGCGAWGGVWGRWAALFRAPCCLGAFALRPALGGRGFARAQHWPFARPLPRPPLSTGRLRPRWDRTVGGLPQSPRPGGALAGSPARP